MQVPGEKDRETPPLEEPDRAVDARDDRIAVRNAERPARTEVVLDVDYQQGERRAHVLGRRIRRPAKRLAHPGFGRSPPRSRPGTPCPVGGGRTNAPRPPRGPGGGPSPRRVR